MVPTRCPDRIRLRIFVSENAPGTSDFDELVSTHNFPVAAIPLGKHTRLDIELLQRLRRGLAIVGINQHTLSRVHTFAVRAFEKRAGLIRRDVITLFMLYV